MRVVLTSIVYFTKNKSDFPLHLLGLPGQRRSGWPGFNLRQEQWWDSFFIETASRAVLGPNQPPILWVSGALNWSGLETDHSPPSSAEFKNAWSYYPLPQDIFMTWPLVKHTENFTSYLTLSLGLSARYRKTNFYTCKMNIW